MSLWTLLCEHPADMFFFFSRVYHLFFSLFFITFKKKEGSEKGRLL